MSILGFVQRPSWILYVITRKSLHTQEQKYVLVYNKHILFIDLYQILSSISFISYFQFIALFTAVILDFVVSHTL